MAISFSQCFLSGCTSANGRQQAMPATAVSGDNCQQLPDTHHLPRRSVSVDPLDSDSLVQNFHPQLGRGRARLRRWAVLEGIGGQRAHPAVQDSPRHSSVNEGRAGREGPSTRSARETAGCPAQAVRRRWPILLQRARRPRRPPRQASAAAARGRRHRR